MKGCNEVARYLESLASADSPEHIEEQKFLRGVVGGLRGLHLYGDVTEPTVENGYEVGCELREQFEEYERFKSDETENSVDGKQPNCRSGGSGDGVRGEGSSTVAVRRQGLHQGDAVESDVRGDG